MVTERTYQRVSAPSKEEVEVAAERIASHLRPTPLIESPLLGALLKLETLQPTGSFKVRGALAALTRLEPGSRVVTASAGNHGLGVAWAAAALGLQATVVVPETASPAKLAALERFAVKLVRHGSSYDEAEARALDLAEAGSRYVSSYNDRLVIAGGGTIVLELTRQIEGPLTIVCPVGGGGLCAGVSLAAAGHQGLGSLGWKPPLLGPSAPRSPRAASSRSRSERHSPTGWPAISSRARSPSSSSGATQKA